LAITLKDVARKAGVSASAVSRTFTDGASVSDATRLKVEKAALSLGYTPNALASSLTTGRTRLIGLVSNNFYNPIFLQVFDLFTRGLQERGLRPLLVNLSDETDPAQSVDMLQQYSVDGVVIASSTLTLEFSQAFKDAKIPVVHSFGRHTSSPQVHVVGLDNVEGGKTAARELVSRGYKSVAFLGGPAEATSTQDRMEGFKQEMKKHPSVAVSHSFAEAYSFNAGRSEMLRILEEGSPSEAYFCGDDVLSIGVLSALQDSGLQVPKDVGIIGLNDMEMSGWENINLTTIKQPIEQIISSSIELIVAMLEDPERYPEARIFPTTVIERGTLKPHA